MTTRRRGRSHRLLDRITSSTDSWRNALSSLPLFDSPNVAPDSRFTVQDICARKHRGSETSEAAYEIAKLSKEGLHDRVIHELRRRGDAGGTCEQLALALGVRVHSMSGRLAELKAEGRIVLNGQRRPTSSGCSAAVVVLAELA